MAGLEVVDLFVGLGGFSAGALAAGATVVLGVDRDAVPLRVWSANVPSGRAVLATLGPEGDAVELPPPSERLHVHASPPCTELSTARGAGATADGVEEGLAQMRWAVELLLARGDASWSLENVSTPATRALLSEYAGRFPDRVAWATLDAADFGAAQTRVRLIAGPLALIKALQEMPGARRVSVRAAFEARGIALPAAHFKNQARRRSSPVTLASRHPTALTLLSPLRLSRRPDAQPRRLCVPALGGGAGVHRLCISRFDVVRHRWAHSPRDDAGGVGAVDGLSGELATAAGLTGRAARRRQCHVRAVCPGDRRGRHRCRVRHATAAAATAAPTATAAAHAREGRAARAAPLAQTAAGNRGAAGAPSRGVIRRPQRLYAAGTPARERGFGASASVSRHPQPRVGDSHPCNICYMCYICYIVAGRAAQILFYFFLVR